MRALFAFRHRIYCDDLGWFPPRPDGLLLDEFDDAAFNYGAFSSDGTLIGGVRVVPDGPMGLPLEHCIELDGQRTGRTFAEICRLAIDSAHRGGRLAAFLMKAAYQRCLMLRVSHIAVDTYLGGADSLYDHMGFVPLGEPYFDPSYDCDMPVVALSLDVERALRELPETNPRVHHFFTSTDSHIEHE